MNNYTGGNGYNNNGQGNGNKGSNGPGGPGGHPPKGQGLLLLAAALITMIGMSFFMKTVTGASTQEITYNEFLEMVEDGKVESVEITDEQINIYPKERENENPFLQTPEITYYTGLVEDASLTDKLLAADVDVNGYIPDNSGFLMSILLTYVLPLVILFILFNDFLFS